jgi:signal transduction histidine kinase
MPWYDSAGEIRGIVGHTQDITERKLREHAFRRQHERMVKVALVASHELRNELQIAYDRLEELRDCDDSAADIEESLSQISTTVDTVVELSTSDPNGPIQHGEIERVPKQKHVWLSRLSREVWDTLADSRACLTFEGDTRIVADQESTGLLLQILFQNALEHAGPSVTATVSTTADGFFIADDGPGIDVEPPERVFDAGHTAVAENTGFGSTLPAGSPQTTAGRSPCRRATRAALDSTSETPIVLDSGRLVDLRRRYRSVVAGSPDSHPFGLDTRTPDPGSLPKGKV